MSTETSEKAPNYHQARREKIAAAITAWQRADDGQPSGPYTDADALEDILREHGLQIVPTAAGYGRYRVLIDDQAAPHIGSTRPAGPVDADQAVEIFLIAALGAEADGEHTVTIRPATDAELVQDFVGGVL
ncbi:hypothetical protein AB0395_47540 [Streptosporangium sp. NPDC051023]|uniref:hypothetical protein n=1 Tax=Streptosporangium sp. NPDC051023 TaxID=3155410 RepID=UPI00344EBB25